MSRRIPGPYRLDRPVRTIFSEGGPPVCFGFAKFPYEREQNLETLRFFVAAANVCANIPVEKLEEAADRQVEIALGASLEEKRVGPPAFDLVKFTEELFGMAPRNRKPL